ncbi:hypothetical protein L227DRAFT_413575 [Lentinus tigrinus ALCF2SS1-6]|uniref:Uncharacterized protein n=1 Tax=Lentinus tigrinus ALCF2SS1-6 TaxID=1328759 RepID=A0A5C2SHC0_9APHY|nr:hypothetical protein L227DRAFT_413575 [Lentinus tigrinus ALCF2SS1-6]
MIRTTSLNVGKWSCSSRCTCRVTSLGWSSLVSLVVSRIERTTHRRAYHSRRVPPRCHGYHQRNGEFQMSAPISWIFRAGIWASFTSRLVRARRRDWHMPGGTGTNPIVSPRSAGAPQRTCRPFSHGAFSADVTDVWLRSQETQAFRSGGSAMSESRGEECRSEEHAGISPTTFRRAGTAPARPRVWR